MLFPRIYILVFIIVWGAFEPLSAYSQKNDLKAKISVNYSNVPLGSVLKDISQRTGLEFSYSEDVIPVDTLVNFKTDNQTLDVVLANVLYTVGVHYSLIDSYLVLRPLTVKEEEEAAKVLQKIKYTISGYAIDMNSGEALIGAAIYDSVSGMGTTTNNYGYYSFSLPKGNYVLKTSYLGYQVAQKTIALSSNHNWQIVLEPQASFVQEIVVKSLSREDEILHSLKAETNISIAEVKKQTAALGETDLLKSLDNLPGISFQGDGSSYFFVRGGNRDQNMILLDEAPLYNPTHMLGLFTPIIPDAIKSTSIYKSDFPIQYGGRLSSLIDIRTRDGNMERFSGSASIGLVSTRLSIEGPFKKEVASYFISFRRSHFGMFAKSAQPNLEDFYFSDFTAKFNTKIGKRDRLFFTVYSGQDKFINRDNANQAGGLAWGNNSFTARWNHVFGQRLFSNTTFYTSQYNYNLYTNYDAQERWNSHISSVHLKTDFTWYLQPESKLSYGLKVGSFFINPGNHNGPGIGDLNTVSPTNSVSFIAYGGLEQKLGERWDLNAGIRLVNWSNYGEAWVIAYENNIPVDYTEYEKGQRYYSSFNVEPRIGLQYKIAEYTKLRASYNRTLQHIHLINNSISPYNSLEVWLPSGPNIKPQKADIYNLGFAHYLSLWNIQFGGDVFYKKLHNQMAIDYHANTLLNAFLEGEIRQGMGKAYGFELMLKRDVGKFTGQIGYAFTRSTLKINGINNNKTYKARQDKPVDFSLALSYKIKPRWLASINYVYASGMRITTPGSYYYYRGKRVPVYTEQYNDRMPDYSRFDVSSHFKLDKGLGRFEHYLNVSIFNLFNKHNANFLYFNKTEDKNGDFVIPSDELSNQEQLATIRYLYSVVPSVTYSLNF